MKGRWIVHRGEDLFVEANNGVFSNYPDDADLYAIDNMQEVDKSNRDEAYDFKFYYGRKELQKMGIEYTYPDPTVHNNL